jgi:Fe2+ transport system protein FeoA
MAPLAAGVTGWAWEKTLAVGRPGQRYQVVSVLFPLMRDRCAELGFREGDEITCRGNARNFVDCRVPKGRMVHLRRDEAWFIRVAPVAPRSAFHAKWVAA